MAAENPTIGRAFIKELVAKNQSEKVIDSLVKLAKKIDDKDLSNSIIILSGKFENYVKDSRNGVLSQEQQDVSLAKLNEAILELIDDIPENSFKLINQKAKPNVPEPRPSSEEDKLMKYMIMSLFAFGLLGIIFSLIYNAFKFLPADAPDFRITDLILPAGSLTTLFTGGLFYTLTKK